jgi:hypothetical protein
VERAIEHLVARTGLDDAPQVHHRHDVGDVADERQVVGDEEEPHPALGLQIPQEVHDLRLHREVEG